MLATTAEHDLAVAVTKHRIGTRVTVRGEVDLLTSPELSATLDRVTAGSTSEVEVDLSGVTFFGCSGAAVLARAAGRARRRGGRTHGAGRAPAGPGGAAGCPAGPAAE